MNVPNPVLRFERVTKRRPAGFLKSRTVLDGLSFSVAPGETVGLLGHNGAGKSTSMRILLGLTRPDAGAATAFGASLAHRPDLRRRVAYLPENARFAPHLTPREQIAFAASVEGRTLPFRAAESLLERVGLDPALADRRFETLSKGMMQRVALALMELSADAELLVLDEPATGLDPHGRKLLRDLVRARTTSGAAALISSHDLSEIGALCDRVAVIRDGRLVADTKVSEILAGRALPDAPPPYTLEDYYLDLMGEEEKTNGDAVPAPLPEGHGPSGPPDSRPPRFLAFPLLLDAWRGLVRDRIGLALVAVALALVALAKLTGGMSLEFQSRVLKDLSLACVSLVTLTLFPLAAAHGIRSEFDRGTLGMLLARPVSHGTFLAARFLAVAGAAAIFAALLVTQVYLLLLASGGHSFASLAGAGFLIWLKSIPLIALAVALSPHAGRATVVACAVAAAASGHMAQGLTRAAAEGSPALGAFFGALFGYLLPDYAFFGVDFSLPARAGLFGHLALLLAYAGSMAALYLMAGAFAFGRKDL